MISRNALTIQCLLLRWQTIVVACTVLTYSLAQSAQLNFATFVEILRSFIFAMTDASEELFTRLSALKHAGVSPVEILQILSTLDRGLLLVIYRCHRVSDIFWCMFVVITNIFVANKIIEITSCSQC